MYQVYVKFISFCQEKCYLLMLKFDKVYKRLYQIMEKANVFLIRRYQGVSNLVIY